MEPSKSSGKRYRDEESVIPMDELECKMREMVNFSFEGITVQEVKIVFKKNGEVYESTLSKTKK